MDARIQRFIRSQNCATICCIEGLVSHNLNSIKNDLSELYYRRYPIAKEIAGQMWFVQLNAIVMSNISKAFGEKLYWKRSQN